MSFGKVYVHVIKIKNIPEALRKEVLVQLWKNWLVLKNFICPMMSQPNCLQPRVKASNM